MDSFLSRFTRLAQFGSQFENPSFTLLVSTPLFPTEFAETSANDGFHLLVEQFGEFARYLPKPRVVHSPSITIVVKSRGDVAHMSV
jgi:hypothetical protein